MEIPLNASMLNMHPGIGSRSVNGLTETSDIATAVDKDKHMPNIAWNKCASSRSVRVETTTETEHWLSIDLKGVFLISRVRAAFRIYTGSRVAVFVGNHPFRTDGSDGYQCGDRLDDNAMPSPVFHNFTCQLPTWASHVSVQRIKLKTDMSIWFFFQVCEVEVYYSSYASSGMLLFLHLPHNHIRHCSAVFAVFHTGVNVSFTSAPASPRTAFVGEPLLCTTSLVTSNATSLLQLRWSFPNGTAVSQDSRVSVTQQDNAISLSFNNLEAPKGDYSCNYTLNGKLRSQRVSVSGEMETRLTMTRVLIVPS